MPTLRHDYAVRFLCVLAVLFLLPVHSTAQQRRNDDRRTTDRGSDPQGAEDRRPARATFDPRLPSWEQARTPWWEQRGTPWWEGGSNSSRPANDRGEQDPPRQDHRYRSYWNNNCAGVVYIVPSVEIPATVPTVGSLYLFVEPRALLQIYVDDVFLGTPGDVGDELRLAPGIRRVELRAKGYKPLAFSTNIVENRSINYQGALERDPSATPVEPAEARPSTTSGTTMYRIPGCYLGNVMPRASDLRPGCDISKMTTFKP